jgi:hypothetical protein
MTEVMVIQGWELHAEDIGLIRSLLAEYGDWRRTRISEELCRRRDRRNGQGRFKDMAARRLLLKLERAGLIQLQKRRRRCSASSHANFHRLKAEVATLKAENATLRRVFQGNPFIPAVNTL